MASRAKAEHPIKRFGLTEVYAAPSGTQVDIVFIHGLHGNPKDTWSSTSSQAIWPTTLLGPILQEEKARILVYGYDAQVASFTDGMSSDTIHTHAEQLVAELTANRRVSKATEHPIIFVAHSLGGLVVKRALIYSSEISGKNTEHLRSIFVSTYGILFLGTPHKGLNATNWQSRLEAICQAALPNESINNDLQLINTLKSNNETLQNIDRQFIQLSRSLHMFFFHEGKPTHLGGGRWEYIVDEESASPTIQDVERAVIQKDHIQMCKFGNSREPGFHLVTEAIHRYTSESTGTIGPRWDLEKADRLAKRRAEAEELLRTTKPIFSVKFPRDDNFVNREHIFTEIDRQMDSYHCVSLCGWGGVGKSQIAIEYAYRFRQSQPESHIFWVYAATYTIFEQAYIDIARRLKLPGCEDPKADLCKLVVRWLDEEVDCTWLMILDNADNANVILPSLDTGLLSDNSDSSPISTPRTQTPLIEFLPTQLSDKKRLLITTRDRSVSGQIVDDEHCITVPPMSPQEANICLRSKLELSTDVYENISSEKLLNVLAHIPLAITQAAAFMRRNGMSTQSYLEALEKDQRNLTDFLSYELLGDPRRQRGTPNSVFRTWRISFEYIMQTEPATAQLLSLAAMLSPQQIPAQILRQSLERDVDFCTAVGTLKGYQLITNELEAQNFTIHPLVQASLQYWLDQRHQKATYVRKALKLLEEEFPVNGSKNKETCELLVSHAQMVLSHRHTLEDQMDRAPLLYKLGQFELSQGKYDDAYSKISEGHDILLQFSDESSTAVTRSLTILASVLQLQGKYKAAEEMNRRVLQEQEKTLGVEHLHTLTSVSDLAIVLRHQGKYKAAEEMNRRALQEHEKILGAEHPITLISVSNLAVMLHGQGKYEAAEKMNRRALQGQEKALGAEHPVTLISVNNLASVLQGQGKYTAAEKMNRRALQEHEKILGAEHPITLISVSNLAVMLHDQGKYEAAEKMNRRALQGQEKILGVEHPDTLTSVNNLASVLQGQGKYTAAEKMNRRALQEHEKILGAEHPITLISVSNLAVMLHDQGKYEAAEKMNRRALQGQEKALGAEHPVTLISVNNLASILHEQGKYTAAEEMNRRALQGRKKILGTEHPLTLISVNNLALTLQLQGKYEAAEEKEKKKEDEDEDEEEKKKKAKDRR